MIVALLPNKVTPEEIIKVLDQASLVQQVIKDLNKFVHVEITRGADFPGRKLVQGKSNRKWVDELKTTEWLGTNTKLDELFISKLISPAQAEGLDKALKKNKDFKKLYEKPEGKQIVVSDKDPRPAIQVSSRAIDVFKEYTIPKELE